MPLWPALLIITAFGKLVLDCDLQRQTSGMLAWTYKLLRLTPFPRAGQGF